MIKKLVLFSFCIWMTHLGFSQEFNFYKEENLFGEKMYGLNDGHGLEVTGLKWKKYYNCETSQFGQPIAVVSEYGHNFHFINLQGARTSLFSKCYFYQSFMQ